MNEPTVLNCLRMPARLDVEQTARVLGFAVHDVPVLVRAKLIKPLGSPAPNAPKYFALCDVEVRARDLQWLDRATRALQQNWQRKNERKTPGRLPRSIEPSAGAG